MRSLGLPLCLTTEPEVVAPENETVRVITRPRHAAPVRAWTFIDENAIVPGDFVMDLGAVLGGRREPYSIEMFVAPVNKTLAKVAFDVERSVRGQTWRCRRMFDEVFDRPRSFRMGHEATEAEKLVRLRFSFRGGPGEMRIRGILHTPSHTMSGRGFAIGSETLRDGGPDAVADVTLDSTDDASAVDGSVDDVADAYDGAGEAGLRPPSCNGLAQTCGPKANEDCCATIQVPGA